MDKVLETLESARDQLRAIDTGSDRTSVEVTSIMDSLINLIRRNSGKTTTILPITVGGQRFFRWVVEIRMDEKWVADGFDITDQRMCDTIMAVYPHISGTEVECQVISHPPDEEVAKEMGFKNVQEYLEDRENDWHPLSRLLG